MTEPVRASSADAARAAWRTHRNLDAWKVAVDLAMAIYAATDGFPKAEMYGLISQMRRAGVSIPSNIAEGAARAGSREYLQFLNVAGGSLSELDTQIEIATRLGFLSAESNQRLDALVVRASCLLAGLIRSVRGRQP